MTPIHKFKFTLLGAAVATLAACSSPEQVVEPINGKEPATSHLPKTRASESPSQTAADYAIFQSTLTAAKQGDDVLPAQFLSRQSDSAMGESVRNEWLKSLGSRNRWDLFQQQYAKLEAAGRSLEVRCYADYQALSQQSKKSSVAAEVVQELGRQAPGCNRLLEEAARRGDLKQADAWRRVRGLISNNQMTDARNLAVALGSPLDGSAGGQGAQEALLINVIGPTAQKSTASAGTLESLSGSLTREQVGFAWGVLGYVQAKNQNFGAALSYYNRADRKQLSADQFDWYARSALRLQRWNELADIIRSMSDKQQKDPTWLYWLGRSMAAQGNQSEAKRLYEQAAASGRNFYALLAGEELGRRVDTKDNVAEPSSSAVNRMAKDGAIDRALNLFRASLNADDWNMRRQAQAEWRYAIRGFDEDALLTAAQLAFNNQFYEMAINTADNTNHKLSYSLRYISPFKDLTTAYANQAGVDPAWVYGLIRQESRFMMGARSHVGAHGLMQVMPATAQEIARKIGMSQSDLYTTEGNIRMGTWYMADTKARLSNSEVLASAGYNAGPSRARRWQGTAPMEAAIYAETIPFNETRDYVKKVMANATYYANLFNEPNMSLKQRIGTIPAR